MSRPRILIVEAEASRVHWALPVVFLTAFAAPADLARVQRTEPPGLVRLKPFDEEELRAGLAQAVPNRAALLPAESP